MEKILAPSILAADFTVLGEQIKAASEGGAPYLHVDVMDGMFVPSISFGMPVMVSARKCTDLFFDVHVMIEKPGRYIKTFAECGADGITFHVESDPDHVGEILKQIHETKSLRGVPLKAGVAIKPGTPISAVMPYVKDVDVIMVMTVEPGFGGQKLIPETIDKVRALRAFLDSEGLAVDIEVDGGISSSNVSGIIKAGANVIVAGSSVFKGDIKANVVELIDLINES
jgi:ribulose-phosphate 3-epimerase